MKGGDKLAAKLQEIVAQLATGTKVGVGFYPKATYEGIEGKKPVAFIAAIQEFGDPASGIPPRPFFRQMIAKEKGHWGQDVADRLNANNFNAQQTLLSMGILIKEELEDSINHITEPALSKVTIMLRAMKSADSNLNINFSTVQEARAKVAAGDSTNGADETPLIDSGHMANSITYEVDGE